MALFIPKKVPLNWYLYDVSFSIELMRSFVQSVEELAADSILKYQTKKSEGGHQGLDEDTFDLREIFEDYFPSLQRRSALLTVWGLLEHELDRLCLLYQSRKGPAPLASDSWDKGIDRSTVYLEDVAGLEGLKASPQWNYLKIVQRIRNVIAHADGKLGDREDKRKAEIFSDMKRLGFLSGDDEIVVAEGFLSKVVDACDAYFKLIAAAVAAKGNPNSAKQ